MQKSREELGSSQVIHGVPIPPELKEKFQIPSTPEAPPEFVPVDPADRVLAQVAGMRGQASSKKLNNAKSKQSFSIGRQTQLKLSQPQRSQVSNATTKVRFGAGARGGGFKKPGPSSSAIQG